MADLNRRALLDAELRKAVEEVTSFPEADFLKCFQDAAKGKVRLTSTTKESLKNLHKLFVTELEDKTFVFIHFSVELILLIPT